MELDVLKRYFHQAMSLGNISIHEEWLQSKEFCTMVFIKYLLNIKK